MFKRKKESRKRRSPFTAFSEETILAIMIRADKGNLIAKLQLKRIIEKYMDMSPEILKNVRAARLRANELRIVKKQVYSSF